MQDIRTIRPIFILLLPIAVFLYYYLWFFFIGDLQIINTLFQYSTRLIQPTLVIGGLAIFLFIYLLLIKTFKLRFTDIGLKKDRLFKGIVLTFILWFSVQATDALILIITQGNLHFHNIWSYNMIIDAIGNFIAQVFGNALFEEIFFRGFILTQLIVILTIYVRKRWAVFYAIIISSIIFSLTHIPVRLYRGELQQYFNIFEPSGMIALIIIGVIFALIYIRTDNLFFLIGIHTLSNAPMPLFESSYRDPIFFILFIIITLFYHKINVAVNPKKTNAV